MFAEKIQVRKEYQNKEAEIQFGHVPSYSEEQESEIIKPNESYDKNKHKDKSTKDNDSW